MAFGVTFAGVPLNVAGPDDPKFPAAVDAVLERMDTLRAGWPASNLAHSSFNADPRQRRPKFGTLFDPAGAGRHAIGVFLGTLETVAEIRAALATARSAFGSGSGEQQAWDWQYQTLKLETDQGSVERTMRMLPPKPIAGLDTAKLFVLIFVDRRFDWHADPVPFQETWIELLDELDNDYFWPSDDQLEAFDEGTQEDFIDRVSAHCDILIPSEAIWEQSPSWPGVVESLCATMGLRYNGQYLLDYELAHKIVLANRDKVERIAGGVYPFGSFASGSGFVTLPEALPSQVRMAFRFCDWPTNEWFTVKVDIDGALGPPKIFRATGYVCACESGSGCDPGSLGSHQPLASGQTLPLGSASVPGIEDLDAIAAYVQMFADDFADYQSLGVFDVTCPGIVALTPDGIHDFEWTYRADQCTTRMYRDAWDAGVDLVHIGACPADMACSAGSSPGDCSQDYDQRCVQQYVSDVTCEEGGASIQRRWRVDLPGGCPHTFTNQAAAAAYARMHGGWGGIENPNGPTCVGGTADDETTNAPPTP